MNKFYQINIHQWTVGLVLIFVFLLVSCLSQANGTDRVDSSPVASPKAETSASPGENFYQPPYLLIFRAYPPHEKKERNLYELAEEIKGFVDGHQFPPSGIMTNDTIRYGVLTVIQARVLKSTDSARSPKSPKDGVYFLSYDRTYKICAKNYVINPGKITYTDYQNSKKYNFPIKKSKPFSIRELEITGENILRDLWEAKQTGQTLR